MTLSTTTSAPRKLLTPEEIAARGGTETPFLRLAERGRVFAERELRLRQLAAGHAMRDYLMLVAEIAHAQQELLANFPAVALPSAEQLGDAASRGVAPLAVEHWPRDPAWRDGFRQLLAALLPRLGATEAAHTLSTIAEAEDGWLEQQADRLLGGVMLGLDLAAAPVLAAALQVYWTHLVLETRRVHAALPGGAFGRVDDDTACPCCASRPTASVTRIGDVNGQRYLHCALCSTEWHMVRIRCTHCGSTSAVHYQSLEALPGHEPAPTAAPAGAVQAECCDDCHHYLKIVHMEKDPLVDAVADDLASLPLDLLVSDAGHERHGVNLMLLFGDPDPGDT